MFETEYSYNSKNELNIYQYIYIYIFPVYVFLCDVHLNWNVFTTLEVIEITISVHTITKSFHYNDDISD